MKVSVCIININDADAGTPTYIITLETGDTIINMTSTFDTDNVFKIARISGINKTSTTTKLDLPYTL
jgi:hypothetical protein